MRSVKLLYGKTGFQQGHSETQVPTWCGLLTIAAALFFLVLIAGSPAFGQADQGAITGTVTDPSNAPVPGAKVALNSIDSGLILNATTDQSGVYTFSPVKIGNYSVSVTATGFSTTTQQNLQLHVQQRLAVDLQLTIGSVSQQVEVTAAPPAMQTEDASVGQTISNETINDTPLNGRNYVYIAHLSAGVVPTGNTRGGATGDFTANGQSSGQNNFVIDGVDNNVNVVDYLNGASYSVRPPPDALSEFKVQTANYSAEFGHSAGAVVNASVKSGTNHIHGDLWEYFRNTALDAKDWTFTSIPPYHQNQFGGTLGLPIIKNKLFWFGDMENNRIATLDPSNTFTVPTAAMRTGNFSELLQPTSLAAPVQLMEPGTNNPILNDRLDLDPNLHLDVISLNVLSLYPCPTVTMAQVPGLVNNCKVIRPVTDNSLTWDTRVDWIINSQNQAFIRYSNSNERRFNTPPMGPILDGGDFNDDGPASFLGENTSFSMTHIFNPTLTNEFRVGYNFGHFTLNQPNKGVPATTLIPGLGGIPFATIPVGAGGLPSVTMTAFNGGPSVQGWGTTNFVFTTEHQNIMQVLDNVTKVAGNHTVKMGVTIQYIRFATFQPPQAHGSYAFTGVHTGPQNGVAGSGLADFLLDQVGTAAISSSSGSDQLRWDNGAFIQDDWKVNKRLTVNLGLRWEDPTQSRDLYGAQANFQATSPLGINSGTGNYLIPISERASAGLGTVFPALAAANRISIVNDPNPYLVSNEWKNFGPRLGLAFKLSDKAVLRAGWGLFDGGLSGIGYGPSIGENFPFLIRNNFTAASCISAASCPVAVSNLGNPMMLETGFVDILSTGFLNGVTQPSVNAYPVKTQIPYTETYNASAEYQLTPNMTATVGYVGSQAHKTLFTLNENGAYGIEKTGTNINNVRAFPGFGNIGVTGYYGQSAYNSLQAGISKRASKGLTFAANYTYASNVGLGGAGVSGAGGATAFNSPIFGTNVKINIGNASINVHQRFTINGNYQLPFGKGRKFADRSGILDTLIGGWASSLTFVAQTGTPFTVAATAGGGYSAAAGAAGNWAIQVRDPFVGGGTPPANNPSTSCPAVVHTRAHWFNPCAFVNPLSGTASNIAASSGGGTIVTDPAAVLPYFGNMTNNQIFGPGYHRINMSLFKDFKVYESKTLQFRTDIFNLFNTPSWGAPSGTIGNTGGAITTAVRFQGNTPDARFFQLSLKFLF